MFTKVHYGLASSPVTLNHGLPQSVASSTKDFHQLSIDVSAQTSFCAISWQLHSMTTDTESLGASSRSHTASLDEMVSESRHFSNTLSCERYLRISLSPWNKRYGIKLIHYRGTHFDTSNLYIAINETASLNFILNADAWRDYLLDEAGFNARLAELAPASAIKITSRSLV